MLGIPKPSRTILPSCLKQLNFPSVREGLIMLELTEVRGGSGVYVSEKAATA